VIFYRYVEYKYVKTKGTQHFGIAKINSVRPFTHPRKMGSTVAQMVSIISDDDSEKEEALEYINQLIDFSVSCKWWILL
jgi:hypothetical protein